MSRARIRRTVTAVAAGLAAAAVVRELRMPREERTWHGRVAGAVPYDFRPPSLSRYRDAMWNPDDPRIFTPRPFGVGWSINAGRVVRLLRERSAA